MYGLGASLGGDGCLGACCGGAGVDREDRAGGGSEACASLLGGAGDDTTEDGTAGDAATAIGRVVREGVGVALGPEARLGVEFRWLLLFWPRLLLPLLSFLPPSCRCCC